MRTLARVLVGIAVLRVWQRAARLHGCPVVARVRRRKPPTAADLDLEALGRAHYEDACEAFCCGGGRS